MAPQPPSFSPRTGEGAGRDGCHFDRKENLYSLKDFSVAPLLRNDHVFNSHPIVGTKFKVQTTSKVSHEEERVEQNLPMALKASDDLYILSNGQVVHESTPAELRSNEEIKARYVGVSG